MNIVYKINVSLSLDEIMVLLEQSGYFPFEDKTDTTRILNMFTKANLVVSAWHENKLIGIARCLTDFSYCCYLSDLAVNNQYKGKGIGKRLVFKAKEHAGATCKLILHSNLEAEGFYEKIGMTRISSAFILQRSY